MAETRKISVSKISVSMPPEVIERVKLASEAAGESVSAWLTAAAERLLQEQATLAMGRIAADRLVAEYEAEFGPIPQQVVDEVEAFVTGPGPRPLADGPAAGMREAG